MVTIPMPVVLKIGGSLLALPDLMERLMGLIHTLRDQPLLVIPGGGFSADVVRQLDERFRLTPAKAHWDAIAAMSSNAAMLTRLERSLLLVRSREEAQNAWAEGRTAVLDASLFVAAEELRDNTPPLATSWHVTSDSIAAWVARQWPADRLILVKSCDAEEKSLRELSASGKIDASILSVMEGRSAEWLNLRADAQETSGWAISVCRNR